MPRLREISRRDADQSVLPLYDALFSKDRDPVEQPGTATGTPGNWCTVFVLAPECFSHAVAGFQFYRSKNRRISPKLRELGRSRAGYVRGSQFVFFPALQGTARHGLLGGAVFMGAVDREGG